MPAWSARQRSTAWLGFDGIRYPSKHGHDIENWALFEPFKIAVKRSHPIALDDPDLNLALKLLTIEIGGH